jgi:hypothetical protein
MRISKGKTNDPVDSGNLPSIKLEGDKKGKGREGKLCGVN